MIAVASLVVGLAAALAACSVPREADLTAGNAAGPAPGAVPATPLPAAPRPAIASAAISATPSPPSASPLTTPSASPSPQVRKPTPAAVPGYTLTSAPASVGNPLSDVKGARDVFGPSVSRSVGKGTSPVGLLFLFAVRPQYLQDPTMASVLLSRVTTGMTRGGVPARLQRFGRQKVAVASSADGGTTVVWLAGGVLAVVCGADPAPVTTYARAYIAAS